MINSRIVNKHKFQLIKLKKFQINKNINQIMEFYNEIKQENNEWCEYCLRNQNYLSNPYVNLTV